MSHLINTIQQEPKESKRYLIVGLGNPDSDYENTLHNVGFGVADLIAEEEKLSWKSSKAIHGEFAKFELGDKEIIILKPQTYMNRSGLAVQSALRFWKTGLFNLLVIQDDSDIVIGRLKVAFDQSSGGHKGIESIIQSLKNKKFARLKVGVRAEAFLKSKEHVKAEKFILRPQSKELLGAMAKAGKEIVYSWLDNGLAKTMSIYNDKDYKYNL